LLSKIGLENSHICNSLSEADLSLLHNLLSPNSHTKTFQKNETIISIGDSSKHIYLLQKGTIKSINYTLTGEEISFFYFYSGEFVGLLNCLNFSPYNSQYIAYDMCEVVIIPSENFMKALDFIPVFTKSILLDVADRSIKLVKLETLSRQRKTRDRICAYLYMQYTETNQFNYTFPFTIEHLAKRLNLTRSALSKELHFLENQGIIQLRKNSIKIINIKKLKENCLYLFI